MSTSSSIVSASVPRTCCTYAAMPMYTYDNQVGALQTGIDKKGAQFTEAARAAHLDDQQVAQLVGSLEEVLAAKTAKVQHLRYDVLRASKAYNDSLRTYTEKLARIGIPRVEIDAMGFAPLPSVSSVGPAGLVVK